MNIARLSYLSYIETFSGGIQVLAESFSYKSVFPKEQTAVWLINLSSIIYG